MFCMPEWDAHNYPAANSFFHFNPKISLNQTVEIHYQKASFRGSISTQIYPFYSWTDIVHRYWQTPNPNMPHTLFVIKVLR